MSSQHLQNIRAEHPAFSVLIPNFNYARYIGETIQSVLDQKFDELEIVIADNASTDNSVEVARGFGDPRILVTVNPVNLGFSPNLEKVASLAHGRRMLLLSSDDRMLPDALAAYSRLEVALGDTAERAVWGAGSTTIDGEGKTTGRIATDMKLWRDAVRDEALSRAVGCSVLAVPASTILKRCLELLRSPLPFATTCYPKSLHDAVGGYTGGRIINPDKWFAWKVIGAADMVYLIDQDLFEYRKHDAGQGPQEARSGALKHLTDEYIATFSLPEHVLKKAGLTRDDLARAFIEQDIVLRGLVSVAAGQRVTARRALHFGLAAYPNLVRANSKAWALRLLLGLGPLGTPIARALRSRAERAWTDRESAPR